MVSPLTEKDNVRTVGRTSLKQAAVILSKSTLSSDGKIGDTCA